MVLLGNIIWCVLFGWWQALIYALLGLLFYVTIIGIPIGKALFQYAKLMLMPFGKVIIRETELAGKENVALVRRIGGMVANILWLPIGICCFVLNIGSMILSAITIIGIPAAIVCAKSCVFLLWPVGAKVITKEEADTLRMEKSMIKVMGTAMAVNNSMQANQSVQPQIDVVVQDNSVAREAPSAQQNFGGGAFANMSNKVREGIGVKSRAKAENQRRYIIVGIDGMYKGFEFDIDGSMVFGRDAESCNVVFPDNCAGISRVQCQITLDKNTNSVSIIDKYSTYGTTLNGVKLELNRPTQLSEGDVIMFGENNVFKLIVQQ